MANGTDTDAPQPLTRFWQPRHWPVWLGLGLLRLTSLLPVRAQLALGRGLGWLMYWAVPDRRRIAATNLALCFPGMSGRERARLVRRHFGSLGMTLMEHGLAWWASDALVRERVEVSGAEHLRAAVATGRGVVLLTGHFGAQEFTGRAIRFVTPVFGALYRPSKNAFVDAVLIRIRARSANLMIPKQGMRRMIRALRQGTPVWYAPDQSHRRAFSALIPFCGEPAMTNTALSEIARLGNALVVPVLPRRFPATGRYTLEIRPALTGFPGATPEDDAVRVNALLEQHIREVPEQYYWIHRRFKGRPAPFPDPYEKRAPFPWRELQAAFPADLGQRAVETSQVRLAPVASVVPEPAPVEVQEVDPVGRVDLQVMRRQVRVEHRGPVEVADAPSDGGPDAGRDRTAGQPGGEGLHVGDECGEQVGCVSQAPPPVPRRHGPGSGEAQLLQAGQKPPLPEAARALLPQPEELVVQHLADRAAPVIMPEHPALAVPFDEPGGAAAARITRRHGRAGPAGWLEQGGVRMAEESILV